VSTPPQRPETQPSAAAAQKAATSGAESKPGGLDVVRLGPLREQDQGGLLVVLLHGWGAQGDDLVSLARELAHPRARFLVPAAPLARPGGGRAWWQLDRNDRPVQVSSDELPPSFAPNAQLTAARQAVQALLRDARQRYQPEAIAIAGFSQGAMLALDVALQAQADDPPVARVAVMSGALLADSLAGLRAQKSALPATKAALPAVFVSHGRADPVLPFERGASIETVLTAHGYAVTFYPFEGGHQIPAALVARLRQFLFSGSP
jgi:phospholipase/carboxylesterase